MSKLWNWIDNRKLSLKTKVICFLILNSLIYSVAGFIYGISEFDRSAFC